MKNRLIYSLVVLMVISLIGIIVLQWLWLSKAIADEEKEFANRVNTALNDVVAAIDEEEVLFFLEDELSDLNELTVVIRIKLIRCQNMTGKELKSQFMKMS